MSIYFIILDQENSHPLVFVILYISLLVLGETEQALEMDVMNAPVRQF